MQKITTPPIEQNTDQVMKLMAQGVAKFLSPEYGFMIMVFPFDGRHASSYISNANRQGMVKVLRAQADALERKKDIVIVGNQRKQ